MKKINTLYWVFTGLFGAFMLLSAIPDILVVPDAIRVIQTELGYPAYIIPFLGVAKTLGVIAILIPGYPRLREWAYAGLMIDLVGALYSLIAIGTTFLNCLPMALPIVLGILSYIYAHKKVNAA